MTFPVRSRLRHLSYRAPLASPAQPDRRTTEAEIATQRDLVLDDLANLSAQIKAERAAEANRLVLSVVIEGELSLYDDYLPKAGSSAVKQEILARRLSDLTRLNDGVVTRFGR